MCTYCSELINFFLRKAKSGPEKWSIVIEKRISESKDYENKGAV